MPEPTHRSEEPVFFPRELLREAAQRASVEGNVLWYPREYVIVLKADAAVDRETRARAGGPYAERNRARAMSFRDDVISQVQAALQAGTLQSSFLKDALVHLKAARREEVATLLEFAGGGRLSLR